MYFVFKTKAQNQQKCRLNCDKYLNNCSQCSTIMMKSHFYNTATSHRDVNIATWKERLHGWWETAVGINRRLLMWADSCRESRHQRKCSETKSAWSSQISTVSSLWHSHLQNRKVWWGRSLILPPFVPGWRHWQLSKQKSEKQNGHTWTWWIFHLGDGDAGQLLHHIGDAGHDVQHLSWQLGGTHLPSSTGHHGHLAGCAQRLTDLLCHLVDNRCTQKKCGKRQSLAVNQLPFTPHYCGFIRKSRPHVIIVQNTSHHLGVISTLFFVIIGQKIFFWCQFQFQNQMQKGHCWP